MRSTEITPGTCSIELMTLSRCFLSKTSTVTSIMPVSLRETFADASRMPKVAAIRVNDEGALTYERGSKQITALWLARIERVTAEGRAGRRE